MNKSSWKPVGVSELEPGAWKAVISDSNTSVIAGPGAGKTEVLAQRAAYLLQTGGCPRPKNILAICFKRDAVRNLADRVLLRCGPTLSQRFHCYTFDGFAKGMVDRFYAAIPELWRPTDDYSISQNQRTFLADLTNFLRSARPPIHLPKRNELGANPKLFYEKSMLGLPLPLQSTPIVDAFEWASQEYWKYLLHGLRQSKVTFPMLSRIAEALLRANSKLVAAMRQAYSHVLLDEFQDTTDLQYDLLKTAFMGSKAVVTAVGDRKQRIMGWAMALPNAFEPFTGDFAVEEIPLFKNYRSSAELIAVQQFLINALEPGAVVPTPIDVPKDTCRIMNFTHSDEEAEYLAQLLRNLLDSGITPRQITILVRHSADQYTQPLIERLSDIGIQARVENEIQDLVAEPLISHALAILNLAHSTKEDRAKRWADAMDGLLFLNENAGVREVRSLERQLLNAVRKIRAIPARHSGLPQQVGDATQIAVQLLDPNRLKACYPQYEQGIWVDELLDSLKQKLAGTKNDSLAEALVEFEGKNAIPVMTIHKSKGLEYHTVIFLGLEDGAFFSFRTQPQESLSEFFVAFSRAKKTVIFTYAATRPGTKYPDQYKENIHSLYQLLRDAGVKSYVKKKQ